MATKVGTLVVDLIAESAQYVAELKKANKQTSKFSKDVSRSMNNLAGNIAGLAAGYLGLSAVIGQANQAMANAKEIENMARLAGTSVEAFQAATYAVSQYGISAEKLGDISKDTADKLGDFIATGGGEFKDFFELVAPQVGLTAEELQHLSGPEVLLAVKQAMDAANVPMKQQIFYLESIANDASLLIPLLEDNGRAYHDLTREAEDLNLVLSQQDITALRESEKILNRLSQQMSTSFAQAVAASAEQITWFGEVTSTILRQIGNEIDAMNDLPNTLGGSVEKIAETQEAIDSLRVSIEKLESSEGAYNRDIQLAAQRQQLSLLEQELVSLQEHRWALQVDLELPEQPDVSDFTLPSMLDTGTPGPTQKDVQAANQAADDIIAANQRILDSLTRDLATQTERINSSYTQRVNAINDLVLTETQVQAAGFETTDQLRIAYLQKADADRNASLERLKQDTESATDTMESQFAELASAINANTQTMELAATSWANSFSTSLANMVTQGELDFGRLAESIVNDLIRIAIQANITKPLLDAMGMTTGTGGGGTATTPPARATGGPVMKNSTYLVGENGPELFRASNSGSITPNNQLGGSSTTVNVYTQPGETAETTTRSTPQGDIVEIMMKQVDSRLNEQVSRGQGLARTLEGRYSLNRKSY